MHLISDLEEAQRQDHENGREGQQYQQVGHDGFEALAEEDDFVKSVHGPIGGRDHAQGPEGRGDDLGRPPAAAQGGEHVGR